MQLRVPTNFRDTYLWLAKLPDGDAEALISSFEAAPGMTHADIVRKVSAQTGHAPDILERLFNSIVGLVRTLQEAADERLDQSAPEDLSRDSSLDLSEHQRVQLAGRLRRLISCDPIASLAKTIDLLGDHENLFRGARIYSEIRPMFTKDLEQIPTSAAVIHSLKLEYTDADLEERTLYVALDAGDLMRLRSVIDRELAKKETLGRMLQQNGISQVGFNE